MGSVLCRSLSVRLRIALAGLLLARGFASVSTTPAQSPFVVDAAHLTTVVDIDASLSYHAGNDPRRSFGQAGEALALSSVSSALPSEMTAEVLYPSRIAIIERDQFLGFMARHPEVYQTVTQELSLQYKVARGQLRTVALAGSAPEKLARLLLEWSDNGQKTDTGFRVRFSLTHEELGEFIGASRETVTRTLSSFKRRHLVAFHGSMLEIPSRNALESVAGV